MGILVLVLLVAAWGFVLGPVLLRNSQDPSPLKTEKTFRRALRALGGSRRPKDVVGGRWVLVPPPADHPASAVGGRTRSRISAADRRRRNLTGLAGFIVVTFFLGLVPALRGLLFLNIAACVLLVAYLGAAMYFAARPAQAQPRRRSERLIPEYSPPEAAGGW